MDKAQWKVVPVEATPEMRLAGREHTGRAMSEMGEVWAEMLAAAPQPPSASGEREVFRSSGDEAWQALFWQVAEILKCLPSGFVDANEHVLRAATNAMASQTPSPGIDAAEPAAWLTSDGKMLVFADKISKGRARHSGMTPLYAAPPAAQPSAEQQPVAWLQQNMNRPTWFEIAGANDKAVTKDWTDAFPVFRQSADAQPSADDPQFPFYELRFIMRVLSHEGSAPKEDWQTAYGMARAVFERWSLDRAAVPAASADEWMAEVDRLVEQLEREWVKAVSHRRAPAAAIEARAALLAHLKARP